MKKRAHGLSLVELLIALAIGSVLIIGAVSVYSRSRTTNTLNDTLARLQENGRYALSIMEPDIQLAGYYGFTNNPGAFGFITGGSTGSVTDASKMQTASTAVPGLASTAQTCGNNYAVNLIQTVQGNNNQAAFGLTCAAQGGGVVTGTDLLTIRRASNPAATGVIAPEAGRVQLLVNRLSPTNQYVFADGTLPTTPALDPNLVEVRNLVVRSYYISVNSMSLTGLPSLRVKVLTNSGGSPAFVDDNTAEPTSGEVLAGVEDMQVQFGIDTGDYDADGAIDPGLDADGDNIPDEPRGIATRYVNANFANLIRYQVVSVRLWLMIRAADPDQAFRDTRTYTYAGKVFTPTAANNKFHRLLVSRTIQLRNARTF